MAVAADGTVYATESFANRIHRLKPGAKELDLWVVVRSARCAPDCTAAGIFSARN